MAAGEYRVSTRGRSLDEVGFIHASTAAQVEQVANRAYPDAESVVLVIDPERLRSEVRYERGEPGSAELFPHIYGPINLDAVVDVLPTEIEDDD
jgi:glutathione S-transferase